MDTRSELIREPMIDGHFAVRGGGSLPRRPKLLSQFPLQKLSGRTLGNIPDNTNRFWTFVIGQTLLAVADQFFLAWLHSLLRDDKRCDIFTIKRIGNTDRRCGCNCRMLIKDFVYLARIDVLAARSEER